MILLRHGQSEFNLHFTATRRDPGIVDPKLTPLGHEQAEAAAEALAGEDIRRIIASPYTRALQTAAPVAKKFGIPVTITPVVRERYAFSCDIGTPISRLADDWPDLALDHVEEIWWPQAEEGAEGVIARAAEFRGSMAVRPDWPHTLVVSHWGFILALTGTSAQNGTWLRYDPNQAAPERIVWKP